MRFNFGCCLFIVNKAGFIVAFYEEKLLSLVLQLIKTLSMLFLTFTFNQFLGFLAVMVIVTIGFWLMIFLVGLLPYWVGGAIRELLQEKREAKESKKLKS